MKLAPNGFDRQSRKSLVRIGIAVALTATAFGAQAAGLGRLNVLSSIGQPLRAEIELTSVSRDDAGTLSARVASADAFAQANIEYGATLSGLRLSVQRRSNGAPYVLVTSSQLVNEPFLDVLVELSWSSGRLVREYTLLIDPPETRAGQRVVEPGATIVQAQTSTAVMRTQSPRRTPMPAAEPASSDAAIANAAPATAATRRAAPPAAAGASSGDYLVRTGDTALSIARDNKPESVSLEQMLAALYRDNPQAFAGNVDRLLAGATLKIPDAPSAQTIDSGEARRIVAQTSNFGSYRDRIARNAARAPVGGAPGAQASGKLSTQVDDSAAPADANDRLQLSRPGATSKAAATAAGPRGGIGAPSVEDLAAKDRELQETKSRLALLEKNVADLQQLLTLKNQTLADLQKPAAPASPPPAAVSPPAPAPTATVASPPPAAMTAPAAAPAATPAPLKAAPAPARSAPSSTTSGDDWFDSLKDNTPLLAGLIAIVLLLIGYGLFTVRRRRKLAGFEDSIFVDNSVLHANSVFGTTGGQSVDTANSGFHSNFVPVAGNLPEQNEVDPVAEADVYIAYGRDAQAEEILKEALRADDSRHAVRLKLLEIYAKRGDAKTFETMSSELYAATGGHGEDWKQAAALGRTIDPQNPLYAEVEVSAPAAPHPAAPAPRFPADRNDSAIGTGLGSAMAVAAGAGEAPASGTAGARPSNNDHQRTDPMPRDDSMALTPVPSMDLDFDLGFANAGLAPLSTTAAPAPGANAAGPAPVPPNGDGFDFDVGSSTKPLIDPFTASAFGAGDPSARTAVNLPAFRARADEASAAASSSSLPPKLDTDGFSASDIFGSSIVADTQPMFDAPPTPTPTPVEARTHDFRVVESNQYDKTEPFEAFSRISLDLDETGVQEANLGTEFGAKTDIWQAMATKLDLAMAYSDIGDKDGAKELLEEVVRNGDQVQIDRARQLMGELG